MKVGDIIRRKTLFGGTLIGPFKEVTAIYKHAAYARIIGEEEEEIILPNFYKIMNVHNLSVSKIQLESMRNGRTLTISHLATASWEKLMDKIEEGKVDIVMFYNKQNKIYYTIHGVKRVYKFVWNASHTQGKKQPCITIFLDQNIETYGHI